MKVIEKAKASDARLNPAPGSPEHALALARLAAQARKLGVDFRVAYFAHRPLADSREFIVACAATSAPPARAVSSPTPTHAERALAATLVGGNIAARAGWAADGEGCASPTQTAEVAPAKATAPAGVASKFNAASPAVATVLADAIAETAARRRAAGK